MLVVFGLMLALVGALLGGLCLIGGGIICEGTMIPTLAAWFLWPGLSMIVLGFVLSAVLPKPKRVTPQQILMATRLPPGAAGPAPTEVRRASECPKCGGPVKANEMVCGWCDTPLL